MASRSRINTESVSNLTELLSARVGGQADSTAYTFLKDDLEESSISWAELDRKARAVGAWLAEHSSAGDRALLLYPPGIDFLIGFFGCLHARVVSAPLPLPGARTGLEKLALVQRDTEARFALTTAALAEERMPPGVSAALAIQGTDLIADSLADGFSPPESAGELAYLQYTSGSTSAPRGVMVTHRNVLHNLANIDADFRHDENSVVVTWLPHFHDMGLIYGLLAPLYTGMPCYFMSPAAFVQRPRTWLEAITKYKGTHSGGPNFAYDLCVRRIPEEERGGLDLSSWEVAFNGAEPVHAETLERFSRAFSGCGFSRQAFHPAYGLAEASLKVTGGVKGAGPRYFRASAAELAQGRVTSAEEADESARLMVGCGKAGLDTEVAIVDPETLAECPPDAVGEIWVKGPGVAQGYWNRREETAETFGARISGSGAGPFLRTGDLGFFRDGELYIAGRRKDLIIIRGLNHHPSDLEFTARKAHPDVSASIAAAFSVDVGGDERLVVLMEAGRREPQDPEAVARSVRQAIAEKHEVRVYSFALVKKSSIPKTSSGKIQRRLCRSLFLSGKLPLVYESVVEEATIDDRAPAVDRDAILAAGVQERERLLLGYLRGLLSQVLRASPDEFAEEAPITTYGVDSLMAMELQNRLETDLGVSVTAVELLEGATLGGLAKTLARGLDTNLRTASRIEARHETETPLSFEQDRLWLLNQIAPGNAAYHVPYGVRIQGPLDLSALEKALGVVIERHESLRTAFETRNGGAVAVVKAPRPVRIELTDLTERPESEREDEAIDILRRAVRDPFDFEAGSPIRFRAVRLAPEDHCALVVMHHIASDLWSVRLLLDELLTAYQALQSGDEPQFEPLPVQYGDYATWQREELQGEKLDALECYWREKLKDAPGLELATDRPRPEKPSFEGATETISFPSDLSAAVQQFAKRENTTLFTVLLAAFEILAARCSGQTDLVIGTTNANRFRPEVERLIGFFAAPLVVRTRLDEDLSFRETLARVRHTLVEAYAHQELPFSKVVEAAHPGRLSSYTPLFQVMFSVVKSLLPATELPDLELQPLDLGTDATDFDLFINVIEKPGDLRALIVYNADLYNASTVRTLMAAYLEILAKAVAEPEFRLPEFSVPETLTTRAEDSTPEAEKPALVISASFTSEPVEEMLDFWMSELGLDYKIRFAPYNQVFQQLLDPSSRIGRNRGGVNVIMARFEDWARNSTPADLGKPEEAVHNFVEAIRAASSRAPVPFLVCLCPASPKFLEDPERAGFHQRMEDHVAASFANGGAVHVVRAAEIEELYPVAEYYDPHGERLGHVPYTPRFFAALGTMISRKIHAMRTEPYKVVALDCDNTLWRGVCGEDGPEGVVIDRPRRELQQFMREQSEAGMVLTIASKNNEEDVWATFAAHPEMPLAKENFVAWRINWEAKSDGLRDMARELDLGLDSFIFVDDSPTECAEVEAGVPEVLSLQLPKDPDRIPHFLRHVWAFDHMSATEEDKKRSAMYGQRLERRRLQKSAGTLAEFLAELDLKIDIAPARPEQLTRVSQLTQRTNQFNLTTIRRTEGEVREFLKDGECLVAHVSDRFGAYGLVGVVLYRASGDALDVDTFLLSCRALGRGVEHRILSELGRIAADRKLETVRLRYTKTPKNRPARKFLDSVAAAFEKRDSGGSVFPMPATEAAAVAYNPASKPGEPEREQPAPASETPGAPERSIDYARIALELSTPAQVLAMVRNGKQPGSSRSVPYEPPRTPLEAQLSAIWAEMLKVPEVGVNDNFFDLGGHSLLAVQLLSRVRDTFNVDLSLDVVFGSVFSVAELAKAIELYEIEQAGADEYEALLEELEGLSDDEVRALLDEEEKAQSGDGQSS